MYKELALIAPTASGKTAVSINLAHKLNAVILSLDSLAVYKYIDIASAKPSLEERDGIIHFGVDNVLPNQQFDVIEFIDEYKRAKEYAIQHDKNLIIVGGTGFYLKALVDGLSVTPKISIDTVNKVQQKLLNLDDAYQELNKVDSNYMKNISKNDKYRIEKALSIYTQTGMSPTDFFNFNQPKPIIINNINIYEIKTEVDVLRKRIEKRTIQMINNGIIDEVIYLEKEFTREPSCMGSIGIYETLDYLDGKINKDQLKEQIFIHTSQLAKRQRTFNKSQFKNIYAYSLENIEKKILSMV